MNEISTTLDETTGMIGKALASGRLPSIAEAIMGHKGLADNILQLLLNIIESECAHMSQRITPVSPFQRIAIDKYTTFQWKDFIEHL